MFEGLKRRLQLLVGRCVINTVANGKYQIELLAGETRDDIEVKQQWGSKSIPPKKTKGITLSFGGLRDDTIIISTDNSDAPELKEGEKCIYNNFGQFVELLEGKININGSGKQLVTHKELDTALQLLVTAINTHTHLSPVYTPLPVPVPPIPTGPPVTPSTLDISSSKTKTINVE